MVVVFDSVWYLPFSQIKDLMVADFESAARESTKKIL